MTATRKFELQQLLPEAVGTPLASLVIGGLSQDSRCVREGDLFFARSGTRHRGLDFVAAAAEQGAVAALVDRAELEGLAVQAPIPLLAVDDLAFRIGEVASRFYGEPSRQLTMIGVTGTNGKTSCSHYIAQALNDAGVRSALLGTVGNGFPGALVAASHTTPDPIALQRLLAEFVAEGAAAAVMEVSSHALEQGRVSGIAFDIAAFSNLSRDHLDYHGSMEAYGEAKARLFDAMDVPLQAINADDAFGRTLIGRRGSHVREAVRFGSDAKLDLYPLDSRLDASGLAARLQTPAGVIEVGNRLLGHFNLSNLMLCASVLYLAGLAPEAIRQGLNRLQPVSGRMECFGGGDQPLVVVDYAHTPDALEKALEALVEHVEGELWCVFGCGGDRDTGKRAEMGAIAARLAHRVRVTSDNPRTEDPQRIIEMIVAGTAGAREVAVQADRAQAIREAILDARPGDIVLIAGKGHEDYQEINGRRFPFSDQQVARDALAQRNGEQAG
ncbi:UDP-N-acetylmuramoyl-L-alanyl-D-glutamate--2,6-diaminopimelate ligase [Marinobacterium nitratireducens]|uniref:UDP-N-acetylmuramoyl-L-alanyl-D-glutamate--2,6-diaminopimelate ligase n=1 Tax=Marinobacterium nitratireducens TaxID=518897 RepID=A0A917ZG84_9GAMM|nr:UDP-N-acetylmuramoyl-L-alanyl-D-glutamate--2,6-diaminopimelate ligase [Marinobacterium nitratireducens]GGO82536.1 UDP-N-acetylmuramoyl-L-alanyl-D-glutamate--2,6-diaminopimelate ligase [Marinobacterium nitratireducens]